MRISDWSSDVCSSDLEFGDAVAAEDAPGPGTGADAGLGGEDEGGTHRHSRHALDAGRDDYVLRAAHHRLGSEMQRLLRRAALPVDGNGGNAVGEAGGEHHVEADVQALDRKR